MSELCSIFNNYIKFGLIETKWIFVQTLFLSNQGGEKKAMKLPI